MTLLQSGSGVLFYLSLLITITFFFFGLYRATLSAYGSSQRIGQIGVVPACYTTATATGSEPSLLLIPQLMATPDP